MNLREPEYFLSWGRFALSILGGVAVCASVLEGGAKAEGGESSSRMPVSDRALPGYSRVAIPRGDSRDWVAGAVLGYGYTETQHLAPGAHHRFDGRVVLGGQPLPGLGVSARTHLQVDQHQSDELGADVGIVWESELYAVFGGEAFPNTFLGAGVGAGFTQGDSVTESLVNPRVDFHALASYVPPASPYTFGILAGYRYDRRRRAVGEPSRFRVGDRLALGVSEFNALSVGLGGSYQVGDTQFVAELSADFLLGHASPGIGKSPQRAVVSARRKWSDTVATRLQVETSLSKRPGEEERDILVAVEPRVSLYLGVEYQFSPPSQPVAKRSAPRELNPPPQLAEPPTPEPPIPPTQELRVSVTDPEGHPLSDAIVQLMWQGRVLGVAHHSREIYRREKLPVGRYELRVTAERLSPHRQAIELKAEGPNLVEVKLEVATPTGQIRGLVRSFLGTGLVAGVRIEPTGEELQTAADGTFLLDVAPGEYEVVLTAEAHRSQRRTVVVHANGVVVLNADMQRATP